MNLLILGGLFVVALLAIGGAFWLSLSEKQATGTAQASRAATPTPAAPGALAATSLPPVQSEAIPAMSAAAREQERMVSASAPADDETDQPFHMLNGQFYELAAELRALHRQSQDIERRLGMLSDLVSRIEREYGEVGVEAE